MWGTLISAAVSAAGSIYGGMKASEAMKNSRNRFEQLQRDNQNWFDRRYNEDATQRADAQAVLQRAHDAIRRRNRAAAGTAAVMGSSTEQVAATKETNNQALADATSQIVAANEQRKDRIEEQYMQNKQQLNNQLAGMDAQQAQQTAEAIKGVVGVAGNMADMFGKKDKS